MAKQSIQPLSKPFLNEVLSEMTHLQRILLPLLAEHCPTRGCIRCLSVAETQNGSDATELCEQARFLQQYMACATATIYRLNSAAQKQYSDTVKAEFEALNALLISIKLQCDELQPIAKVHHGQLHVHVAIMLDLLADIPTLEDEA